MSRARYQFDTRRKYFATAAGVRLYEFPAHKKLLTMTKVTFATPFAINEKDELEVSRRMEAIVWVGDDGAGRKFLDDVGVIRDAEGVRPPVAPPRIWCRFDAPAGRSGYQALFDYGVIPAGTYTVEPVVVTAINVSGLVFSADDDSVTWRGEALVLTRLNSQILKVLHQNYPRDVSIDQLKERVEKWRGLRGLREETVRTAIYDLRRRLPAGLSILTGSKGYRLPLTDSDAT